ncbi:NAD-dependent protein deacetylase sirtuin-2 [Irineochytrium annulatum]|nr:NAD-dependent protein deacetylase sirtuin-2 [Irineochytrium annulatum]
MSSSAGQTRADAPTDDDVAEKQASARILENNTIEAFAKYVKENNCKKIVVMTGAGISTAAGIPDFRSPGTGLYDNLAKYDLPFPEAVFDIAYFRVRPEPFYALAKELYPGTFKPTICHYLIKLLSEKEVLLRNYTQNIDTLERVAGIPENFLVEAHGSFAEATCVGKLVIDELDSVEEESLPANLVTKPQRSVLMQPACGYKYSKEWVKERIMAGKLPECTRCQGLVKPNITFFGEGLPSRFHSLIAPDFSTAQALIVIGTSLTVNPFASLIYKVPESVPRLLINRDKVGEGGMLGFNFSDTEGTGRDAVYLGDCDTGCERLAELLGWKDELKKMHDEGNAKVQAEMEKKVVIGAHEEGPSSPVGITPIDAMLGDAFKDLTLEGDII